MNNDQINIELIKAISRRPQAIFAHTFIQKGSSFSRPVWLECEDGKIYVVKGRHAGRSIFNDQMIARLGRAMNAPVGVPALIIIPEELGQAEPELNDITPGLTHGTEWVKDTSDKGWLAYTEEQYNRPRFALLSILYGWLCANDRQLIYHNQEPHLVYSVDHGHFFPNGPEWTIENLAGAPNVQPYEEIRSGCNLSDAEIKVALESLRKVSNDSIIEAVAIPPDEWGVTIEERVAMVHFVIDRQKALLENASVLPGEQP